MRLDWVGTSMGGMIGMFLAAKKNSPIRRLVLNDVGALIPWTALFRMKGYVGHGVAATNLAGRTLRDLVLERTTPLTGLPWVGHRTRRWEPEPARWIGVHGMYAAYRAADRSEAARRTTTSPIAKIADRISGR